MVVRAEGRDVIQKYEKLGLGRQWVVHVRVSEKRHDNSRHLHVRGHMRRAPNPTRGYKN